MRRRVRQMCRYLWLSGLENQYGIHRRGVDTPQVAQSDGGPSLAAVGRKRAGRSSFWTIRSTPPIASVGPTARGWVRRLCHRWRVSIASCSSTESPSARRRSNFCGSGILVAITSSRAVDVQKCLRQAEKVGSDGMNIRCDRVASLLKIGVTSLQIKSPSESVSERQSQQGIKGGLLVLLGN